MSKVDSDNLDLVVESEERDALISGMKKRLKDKIQRCTTLQEKLRDVESKYVYLSQSR